jgi:hypothetical protein
VRERRDEFRVRFSMGGEHGGLQVLSCQNHCIHMLSCRNDRIVTSAQGWVCSSSNGKLVLEAEPTGRVDVRRFVAGVFSPELTLPHRPATPNGRPWTRARRPSSGAPLAPHHCTSSLYCGR